MSDKPPFEFVPLDRPPPKGPPRFDFVPLQPTPPPEQKVKAKISRSPNNYISFTSNRPEIAGMSESIGIVDVVHIGEAAAYCSPARGSIEEHEGNLQHGQDSAAVCIVDNTFVLVDADGIGQSYAGDIASKTATSAVAVEPSTDLHKNVLTAETALKALSLPPPQTGYSFMDEVFRKTLETEGNSTTFNQVSIDAGTGQIDGLIAGDGGLSIITLDGRRQHYSFAERTAGVNTRISSKHGFVGNLRRLRDIVGSDIRLNPGDTVFLYSDALQHRIGDDLIIDRVCDILFSEENPDQALAKYFEELGRIEGAKDDDKSLIRYTHSSTVKAP